MEAASKLFDYHLILDNNFLTIKSLFDDKI